jgi:hypothetical protein
MDDRLLRDIAKVREMMLTVHYFVESTWLLAAIEFPGLCVSPVAQDALRSAARIAWQFGYPNVSFWVNSEIIGRAIAAGAPLAPEADVLPRPVPSKA